MNDKIKTQIESAWIARAKGMGYKPGTKKYATQQVEFFAGVMQTLQAVYPNTDKPDELSSAIPPMWWLGVMTGRDLITGR